MSLEGVAEVFAEESFEYGGKRYVLSRPNFITEGAIRKYLEAEDIRRVTLHSATYGNLLRDALDGCRRDAASGVWAYGTLECMRALRSPEHFLHFVWLLLCQKEDQQNLSKETVEKMLKASDYTKPDGSFGNHIAEKVNRLISPTPTTPPEVGEADNR